MQGTVATLTCAISAAAAAVCAAVMLIALVFSLVVTAFATLSTVLALFGGTAGLVVFCTCAMISFAAGCIAACAVAGTAWLLMAHQVARGTAYYVPAVKPFAEPFMALAFGRGPEGTAQGSSARQSGAQGKPAVPPLQVSANGIMQDDANKDSDGVSGMQDASASASSSQQRVGGPDLLSSSIRRQAKGTSAQPFFRDSGARPEPQPGFDKNPAKPRAGKMQRRLFRCAINREPAALSALVERCDSVVSS